jgi:hypothetical membrane protein
MNRSSTLKLTGLLGIVAGVFGICAVLAATGLAGESFSWNVNALSDVGVSQVAALFNYSLIITAALNIVFVIGFMTAYAKALFYVGSFLLILGSVSLALVGVLTEAYGHLHTYVSAAYFFLFPIAMMVIGVAFLKQNMRIKGYVSIIAATIASAIIGAGITPKWHTWLGLGFAVPEILEALILAAWTAWMGVGLIRRSDQLRNSATSSTDLRGRGSGAYAGQPNVTAAMSFHGLPRCFFKASIV